MRHFDIFNKSGFGMNDSTVENLILDLLEWLATRDRSYEEVMDAWRTCCPRFAVWEDATDRQFVTLTSEHARTIVRPTPTGLAFLQKRRLKA